MKWFLSLGFVLTVFLSTNFSQAQTGGGGNRGNGGDTVQTSDGKFRLLDLTSTLPVDYTVIELRDSTNMPALRDCIKSISVDHKRFIGKMIERTFPGVDYEEIPDVVFAATWCTRSLPGDWLTLQQFVDLRKRDQVAYALHWEIFTKQNLNLEESRRETVRQLGK